MRGINSEEKTRRGTAGGYAGASPEQAEAQWADEARHLLTGPGAYEWWYFHAVSPEGNGVVVSLFEGLPFHPKYLTQINRYNQRMAPIQKPWETLKASRYPAAYVALYQGGKKVAQFLNLYPPESSKGDAGDVRIGPNRVTIRRDGSIGIVVKGYPYHITRGTPKKQRDRVLSATLSFVPTFTGIQHQRQFREPDKTGAEHHWVLAAPHGRMTGDARVVDTRNEETELEVAVDALGYHDHVYGQGGLSTGVKTLLWGFVQGETWTAAWHQALPSRDPKHADGLVFFEKGEQPVIIDAPETRLTKHLFSSWLLKHPGRVALHGSDTQGYAMELLVDHKQTLDTAPFYTRLAAKGVVTILGQPTRTGLGTTHMLRLRRLRWPILSDLTLMAITPVSRDDPVWGE